MLLTMARGLSSDDKDNLSDLKRHLYHSDTSFRENIKANNRRSARKYYNLNPKSIFGRLGKNLENLESFGVERELIFVGGVVKLDVCLTNKEMAAAVGRSLFRFRGWQREGKFPKPVNITNSKWEGQHWAAYTMEQARRLCMVLGSTDKSYLLIEDQTTIKKLFDIVHEPTITRINSKSSG